MPGQAAPNNWAPPPVGAIRMGMLPDSVTTEDPHRAVQAGVSTQGLRGLAIAIFILLAVSCTSVTWALLPVDWESETVHSVDVIAFLGIALQVLTYVPLAVLVIVFFYRARRNLDARGRSGLQWGRGWTIGAWFVPLASMVLPILVVGELLKASRPGLPGVAWKQAPFPLVAVGWGVLWDACWIVGRAWDLVEPGSTAERVLGPAFFMVWLGAGALLALIVHRVTRDQAAGLAAPWPQNMQPAPNVSP